MLKGENSTLVFGAQVNLLESYMPRKHLWLVKFQVDRLLITNPNIIHGFSRKLNHFFSGISNRVVQLGLRQPQALINTLTMRRGKLPPAILLFSSKLLLSCNIAGGNFPLLIVLVLISACGCRKICRKKSDPPNAENP